MQNVTTLINELQLSDTYLNKVNQLTHEPIVQIKQIHRLLTSLLIASLHRQLQTDIGRNLVYKIISNHGSLSENKTPFWVTSTTDFAQHAGEGNRLFNIIMPGKKSAIVRVAVQHTKVSFTQIDPIVGVCANVLFTGLALELKKTNDINALLPTLHDLVELAPELKRKDYELFGCACSTLPVSLL